jgi:hypothetical protein
MNKTRETCAVVGCEEHNKLYCIRLNDGTYGHQFFCTTHFTEVQNIRNNIVPTDLDILGPWSFYSLRKELTFRRKEQKLLGSSDLLTLNRIRDLEEIIAQFVHLENHESF